MPATFEFLLAPWGYRQQSTRAELPSIWGTARYLADEPGATTSAPTRGQPCRHGRKKSGEMTHRDRRDLTVAVGNLVKDSDPKVQGMSC